MTTRINCNKQRYPKKRMRLAYWMLLQTLWTGGDSIRWSDKDHVVNVTDDVHYPWANVIAILRRRWFCPTQSALFILLVLYISLHSLFGFCNRGFRFGREMLGSHNTRLWSQPMLAELSFLLFALVVSSCSL